MGVPKFFRFISERYPCINEKIKEYQVPEFDNLYLDMNGIIHVCSHNDDQGPVYISSEEQIFRNIFYYVELMFRIIQPKKVFMMAVDGVAPRAKMNQQRGRRFRSARESELAEKRLLAQNQKLPPGERFDSNCITPGTEFMARLHEQFKFFISHKITTDKLWRIPKIIFSGHDVPGEGEHKIMDYIRYLRAQPSWDPNTRHCLHGLDADLIVLGLSTHEPHFCILREEVKFGRQNKRPVHPEENNYYLLHLSLFRDYLDLEFQDLKNTLDFGYDLEKIIDDWILLGFLVGNDFIPHLPNLHIGNNSLDFLYKFYIETLPSLGGYINEQGTLNLQRFETFLAKIGQHDFEVFMESSTDLKYFDSKRSAPNGGDGVASSADEDDAEESFDEELLKLMKDTEDLFPSEDETETEEEMLKREFTEHKRDYYKNKLEFADMTSEVLSSQAEGYIRAIVWNLRYYYDGCPSWSWYYPHHYSPYLSDLKDFSHITFDFPSDSPFLPFEQLLAVLPAGSRKILPKAFQDLMTSPESPILDYYPAEFETDLNGKKNEWEAVVLLPFIKEDSLLEAMKPKMGELTEEEVRRNSHGPMYIYEYSEESLGPYDSPDFFPDIPDNHAKQKIVWRYEIVVQKENLVKGLLNGVSRAYGFPTLEDVPFKAKLKHGKVKVFDNPSRERNMILHVKNSCASREDEKVEETSETVGDEATKQLLAAKDLLGKSVHVGWPWLVLARVTSVATASMKYSVESGGAEPVPLGDMEQLKWKSHCSEIKIRHRLRMGVELGELLVIVYVQVFEGADYSFEDSSVASVRFKFSVDSVPFPLQTAVKDLNMTLTPVGGLEHGKSLTDIFAPNTECFVMMKNYYGFMAKVCTSPESTVNKDSKTTKITLNVEQQTEPDFSKLDQEVQRVHYFTAHGVASRLTISSHLVSRITGCIFIQSAHTAHDKKNVGLNLKYNKQNQEVLGYTRKENEKWLYSEKTVDLLAEYIEKFPDLFDHFEGRVDNDIYFLDDLFPGEDGKDKVKAVADWISSKKLTSVEKRTCGSDTLDENKIQAIEKYVKNFKPEVKTIQCQAKPSLIHLPKASLSLLAPDPTAQHRLLDRIVSVRASHTIPLGARATIIVEEEVKFSVFDREDLVCIFKKALRMTTKDVSVADEYKSSLAELTVNSKPHINMLTMLAEDYIEHAPAIVQAVESHLLQVPGEIKLPVLYLIDSIIKNVGKKYVQLFTQNIVSTFVGVFEKVDEKGRSQMYKLRQTWGGIFPTNKLFNLDTRVNSIDPAWPITASPSPSIHVNPKFLHNQTQQPPAAVLTKREEILKQQKELLELQKRKVELELMQTKAYLAEHQQKTVEKQPPSNNARDPRLRRQENNDKLEEKPVKLKRIPKLKVSPSQEAIQQEVAQYRVLPKSREESPNVLIFKNVKSKKHKDETPSQEKLLEKRSKREELLKDLQQEQKEAEKIVVDMGKSSKSHKENDHDEAVPSRPKKPKKMPKPRKRKRSPVPEKTPENKQELVSPLASEVVTPESSPEKQPQDTDLRLFTAPVPPPPPPPQLPSPEPSVVGQSPPSPGVPQAAKKPKSDALEPLDGLFGNEDVDLRTFPPPPPVISRPSPPPPLRSPPLFHHVSNEKSWANFKGPPRDVPEESTPKFRKSSKFESRFSSPIEILDDDENGDDRASENCNLIIRQAEEQLSSGDITFAQYNRLLKEVITMNEERKLQEALKKEKHSAPPQHPHQHQRFNKGGVWFRSGRNPHRQRQPPRWPSNGVPPADPVVLDYIAKDPTRTITVDGASRELRHYGETAVIFMGWDDPRELSFQPGQRRLYIDDSEPFTLQLNAPYRDVVIDNVPSKIRLGTPTRELYVDGVFYEVSFGGPPVKVRLGNELKSVRLSGPVPPIRISPNQRKDLVAGKVNMIVDAKDIYPIYLDSKPQRFDISGVPYILRFVEALQTVLINGVPFKIEFGSDLPIPMYFHGEKHYLRFSVLPRGIRPGYVSIVNMEGGRLPSPTPPPPLLAPPPPPVLAQPSQPIEVLASLISSQTSSALSSQNYMVDQPIEPSPQPQTQLDVTALVQKLVAIGVVPPSSNNDSTSTSSSHGSAKEHPTDSAEIHPVDFSKPETMRTRQPGMVNRLFSGIQCSICGVRFPPEHTVKYSQHLDWHFRQNRRERDAMRVAQSRRWYYDVSDWIQFQEIEDQDERAASWFELQKQEQGKTGGADGADGSGGINAAQAEEPSVSSAGVELPASCTLCHDPFDQFYNEEKEEWQLKPAIRVGDLLYHPLCHKDLEERGDEVEMEGLEGLDESLAGPEDEKMETIELDSEPAGSANSSVPSPVPEEFDDIGVEQVHVLEDSVSKEGGVVDGSSELEDKVKEPADENEMERSETELNSKTDVKKGYDDLDDDILHIEVLEQKIETYELSDEEGESSVNREKPTPESEEEVDYSKVTVKEEKMDVCDLVTAQSQPTVVSTIDGNVDLEEATPMSLPKRIKINITSAIGKSTSSSIGVNDTDDSVESSRPVGSLHTAESTSLHSSQPPPPGTSPDRPLDSREDSEPPPPGEEMTPLPVFLKPKLRSATLTSYPSVKRGEELSALCSIM